MSKDGPPCGPFFFLLFLLRLLKRGRIAKEILMIITERRTAYSRAVNPLLYMKSSFKKFITFAAVTAATVAGTMKVAADVAKDEEGREDPIAKFVKENIPVDEILKTVGIKPETAEPIKEKPVETEKTVEIVESLEVEKKPEPVVEKKIEEPVKTEKQETSIIKEPVENDPRAIKIGDAWITDSIDDACIGIVAAVSGYTPDQLVTLRTEGGAPMVFAFSSPSIRNDVTLEEVFFVTDTGRAVLPEDTERENVIAFGKAFITETPELQDYLQY